MQDWLAHRAWTTPDREALVNASSGNAWTYATLDETVEEMAGRLSALGVDAGDHLGAAMETGVEEVCLIHAAMRLGAVLVPLPPTFTPPELAERFDRADVDAVVCDAATESQVRGASERVDPWLDVFTIDDTDWSDATPLSAAEPAAFSPANWDRTDTQLLLFTSGTTGQAKAVQLTMGNLLASATASAFRLGLDPEDRWLVPLSLHHMGGIAPILRSTLYGTTAIVRESFDPGGTVDDLREYDATCVSLVPTMLRRMLSARGTLPDCLRFVLVGGAPCPAELIERCRDYSVPICPTYGMTETASQVATARHTEAYECPESVGQPLLWTDVTVVDESGTPVDPGETGELVVDGPTVTPGYYDDPAATGEAMGPHGLHTGDVGRRDEDCRLYVLNRLDDRILTGGENVDPGEVVDALREFPAVEEAAVVGIEDEEWGERVAALLVPVADGEPNDGEGDDATDAASIDVHELEAFLRDRLAGFKLPRTISITQELPRTVSGTVEREAVRERLIEGATESIDHDGGSARAAGKPDANSGRAELPEVGEQTDTGTADDPESILDAGENASPKPDTEPTSLRKATTDESAAEDDSARALLDSDADGADGDTTGGRALDVDDPDALGRSSSIRDTVEREDGDDSVDEGTRPAEAATDSGEASGSNQLGDAAAEEGGRRGGAALSPRDLTHLGTDQESDSDGDTESDDGDRASDPAEDAEGDDGAAAEDRADPTAADEAADDED